LIQTDGGFGVIEFGVGFDRFPVRLVDRTQQIDGLAKFFLGQAIEALVEEIQPAFIGQIGFRKNGRLLSGKGEDG